MRKTLVDSLSRGSACEHKYKMTLERPRMNHGRHLSSGMRTCEVLRRRPFRPLVIGFSTLFGVPVHLDRFGELALFGSQTALVTLAFLFNIYDQFSRHFDE